MSDYITKNSSVSNLCAERVEKANHNSKQKERLEELIDRAINYGKQETIKAVIRDGKIQRIEYEGIAK
jgi:hypothetical protein